MKNQTRYDEAVGFICQQLRQPLLLLDSALKEQVHEIRLRAGQPVVLVLNHQCLLLNEKGNSFEQANGQELICSYECLEQTFRAICGYSIHTHQQEMVRGYISLKGGHRVGIGGTAVEKEGTLTSIKEISSLNIRIARQIFGAADSLIRAARSGGLLIAGRPGCGKTTVLRDLARQLSGNRMYPGRKVVILDERGELAAMWDGIPQNDVGMNTDVLNGFSKARAMEMAVRSLSPDVIICDEIGSKQEAEGLIGCLNAGVQVIASVHAGNQKELVKKQWVMELLKAGVFDEIALLCCDGTPGTVEKLYRTDAWLHEMVGNDAAVCGDEFTGNSNSGAL